jgi:flagellar basal-body rod protein FlgF
MEQVGYVALSRMIALQRQTEMTAHNMANANTPGFKAARMVFGDYLLTQHRVAQPAGARTIQFVQDRASHRDHAASPMARSGNSLDIALASDGFLAFATPRGERYGRNGRLTLDPDGRITSSEGFPVLSTTGQPLVVAPNEPSITIAADGSVSTPNGEIGRLRVVRFAEPQKLIAEGATLYRAAEGQEPEPVAQPQVLQGMIEESNVNPILELTMLMGQQREFEFAAQFVEREGERRQQAIDRILRRRT